MSTKSDNGKRKFNLDTFTPDPIKDSLDVAIEAGARKRGTPKKKPPLYSTTLTREERAEVSKKYINRRGQQKYYRKNREKLISQRRARGATLRGTWLSSRARAKRRDQGWEITLEEWNEFWGNAPDIFDEDLKYNRRPFVMRGPNPQTDVQIARLDVEKPWRLDNVCIKYKDREYWRPDQREQSVRVQEDEG